MQGLADYHMHTPLCHHAEGEPRAYVEAAAERGLTEMGFACHSPMPEPFDDWRMDREDLPRYIEMVSDARAFGATKGITVKLGLEVDYLTGYDTWLDELAQLAPWDYLIGSVHYLTTELVVDHPDHLTKIAERYTPEEMWECYWNLYEEAIRSQRFDFMAHPDLPKKFGTLPSGDLTTYYEGSLRALKETDTAFEINTAGLRKPIGTLYPEPAFLTQAHALDIPLVISSDAHAPEEVGADFAQASASAKACGYTQLARFDQRQRTLTAF